MKNGNYRKAVRLILTSNFSNRRIATLCGLHHSTIQRYRLLSESLSLSSDQIDEMDDRKLESLFRRRKSTSSDKRIPDWAYVNQQLQIKGVTLMLLWHEYVLIEADTAYSYSQFTYLYQVYRSKIDVTMRQTHYAGEELFIDFAGKTIPYFCEDSGAEKSAQIFVSTLGCSDLIFVYACKSQKLQDWINCHVKMFEYYGGVPAILVPDNLRSAVSKTGKIPEINRTYEDCAEHYGCQIFPARPRKPKDKSKAELAVKLVTRWITARLRNHKFFSVDEINLAIVELLERLNQKPFKRLPGCRRSRFEELDKPMLQPLPEKPYEFGEWTSRLKVGPDYHVYINNHAYSVPYKLVSLHVEARITCTEVEIFNRGKRVAIHNRSDDQGGHTTNPLHRPAQHASYVTHMDDFILWASQIGKATTEMVKSQFQGKPEYSAVGVKACDQLRKLSSVYGVTRLELACDRANQLQSRTVKTVKSILQSNADQVCSSRPSTSHLPLHENLRGASYFTGGQV